MKFTMHLVVPTRLVGPITELLEGEGVLVSMEPYKENSKRRFIKRAARGGLNETGEDLCFRLIRESKDGKTQAELQQAFKEAGRNPVSVSPVTSVLRKKKLVTCDDKNVWRVTEKGASKSVDLKAVS